MSKIDDLVDEYNKHCDNPYSPIDIRAGIRAVVTALRDESYACDYGDEWLRMLDEILGSDAGEKVADSGGAFEGLMDGLAKACSPAAPTTDPAPDVCVWERLQNGLYFAHNVGWLLRLGAKECDHCGKPIAFTEKKT